MEREDQQGKLTPVPALFLEVPVTRGTGRRLRALCHCTRGTTGKDSAHLSGDLGRGWSEGLASFPLRSGGEFWGYRVLICGEPWRSRVIAKLRLQEPPK